MSKKIAKIVLVVLMVIGLFFAASNILVSELYSDEPGEWVYYDRDKPDCKGLGDDCYDMT